ncbi:MAG TPA: CPBP family intramembrane glutamic endopeptidase [Verrucomicrobiae bacterium]|nr:CPBP family intramembrane glutamic endopeptidase [Verrucomicrobiae bacterium]
MRPLRALGIYIAVVFLGGALLAPWLYSLAQACAGAFPKLAHQPFHRFVTRALLILALAGLWPLLRALGATSLGEIGLAKPVAHWRTLLRGFLLGFASLALVAAITLVAGGRAFNRDNDPLRLTEKIVGAALSAVVVAVLEETLFRGGIFGGLRRVFHWSTALVASSMIYALVHFLENANYGGAVTWLSGLELLPHMMRGFTNWEQIVPGFFNLTLAGVLLALAYQRTGNLYFSIGLHAGWIFWLKSYVALTADVAGANAWLWGTGKMIDGWLALAALALTLFVFIRLPLKQETDSVT